MRTKYRVNEEIIKETFETMPENKKEVLRKALYRNFLLTSCYILEIGEITIYKEGFYLQLQGTRSNFSIFCKDDDDEFKAMRKPTDSKLHKLYTSTVYFDESDFDNI